MIVRDGSRVVFPHTTKLHSGEGCKSQSLGMLQSVFGASVKRTHLTKRLLHTSCKFGVPQSELGDSVKLIFLHPSPLQNANVVMFVSQKLQSTHSSFVQVRSVINGLVRQPFLTVTLAVTTTFHNKFAKR